MDKKYVQKWIPRYLFAQKRAALGNLRNFFGTIIERPYMQWRDCMRAIFWFYLEAAQCWNYVGISLFAMFVKTLQGCNDDDVIMKKQMCWCLFLSSATIGATCAATTPANTALFATTKWVFVK
jgi:hypothetical protein